MSMFATALWDIVEHPFCSIFIVLIIWLWVNISYNDLDIRKYSLSVTDCWKNKQYWRILTSPFLHKSLVHLILNVSCLWNVRFVEINYGTWFLFRYSIILFMCETLIVYAVMKGFSKFANNPILTEVLFRVQYSGTSGLILAWLGFQSVEIMNEKTNSLFLLFGFLSIPAVFAPVILLGFFYLLTPRNNGVANSAGLFAGYLLGVGFLRIMDDTYWTVCILFNICLFFLITAQGVRNQPSHIRQSPARSTNNGNDIFDGGVHNEIAVRYYQDNSNGEFLESVAPPESMEQDIRSEPGSSLELQTFSTRRPDDDVESKLNEDNKEEDPLEPLLSDNGGIRNRDTYSSMGWSQVWPFRRTSNNGNAATLTGSSAASTVSPRRGASTNIPHRLLVNEDDHI